MKTFLIPKTVLSFLLLFYLTFGAFGQNSDVVIVDIDFPNRGGLIASLPISVGLVEGNSTTTLSQTLKQALAKNPDLKSIHLLAPSSEASINLGGQSYTAEIVMQQFDPEDFQTNDVTVFVYSCSLAKSAAGRSFLENISLKTGFNVASCSSCNDLNEEFIFDYSVRPLTITNNLFE